MKRISWPIATIFLASSCATTSRDREQRQTVDPRLRAECYSATLLPEDSQAGITDIDDAGRVLVTSFGAVGAWVWDGSRHDLQPPAGGNAIAARMNRHGTIIGVGGLKTEDGGPISDPRLYRWDTFEPRPLATPEGAVNIHNSFINDRGHVAGTFAREDGVTHVFLWRGEGTPADLGLGFASDFNDDDNIVATVGERAVVFRDDERIDVGLRVVEGSLRLDTRGDVAGGKWIASPLGDRESPFFWDGTRVIEPTASLGLEGRVSGLGNAGDLVGFIGFGADTKPFHWRAGVLTVLGTLHPNDVNGSGQVVGVDVTARAPFVWQAGEVVHLPLPPGAPREQAQASRIGETGVIAGAWGGSGGEIVVWKPNRCDGPEPPPPPPDAEPPAGDGGPPLPDDEPEPEL
ncbi:MAG: hypothetical protein HYV09_18425 [Deltaproteobacteria bacterium]|nr:hypothetical protein [Deltaproteobacteria bacterium]